MRYTYMYSFKCGAIERNEVDLGWIYIDIYGWLRIGKTTRRRRRRGRKKKLQEFVCGSAEERMSGRISRNILRDCGASIHVGT